MSYPNAYNVYQKTNVNTASPGKLIVLLYEGAIKNLSSAVKLFEEDGKIKAKNIEDFGKHVQKAKAIITELQVSLDMEKGGEIAKNLQALYVFFNEQLAASIISHDQSKIQSVIDMLSDLADSWRKIANSTVNTSTQTNVNTLNIEG